MSGVRAKFTCIKKSETGHQPCQTTTEVTLQPVVGGSEENKEFWKYTPAGSIQLSTINPEAAKKFEVGKNYYIDFTPAD